MRFPQVSNAGNLGGIVKLTVSKCGNLVETTYGFPKYRNYGETTDVTIPSGFQQVSIFGKPLFSPSAADLNMHLLHDTHVTPLKVRRDWDITKT